MREGWGGIDRRCIFINLNDIKTVFIYISNIMYFGLSSCSSKPHKLISMMYSIKTLSLRAILNNSLHNIEQIGVGLL